MAQCHRPFLQTTVNGEPQRAGGQATVSGTLQGVPSFGTSDGH
jgi:hypothetical protein